MKRKAFSLVELSIVTLVIGILIAGLVQGSGLYKSFKISTARTLTQSSDVNTIRGLVLWIDATRENVLTNTSDSSIVEDGDYIKIWKEKNPQSQEQLSFFAYTSGTYPQYKESEINGLPTLSFDGVDDLMTISSNDRINLLNELSIFVVYSASTNSYSTTNTTGQGILSKGTGSDIYTGETVSNPPFGLQFVNGTQISAMLQRTTNVIAARPTSLMPANNIASMVYSSSNQNLNLYINGNTPATSSTATMGRIGVVRSELVIGRQKNVVGRFLKGYISEIIIFNRALTNEERRSVQNYLSKKWGISVYQI